MPPELAARLEDVKDDPQAQFEIGVEHAVAQCRELIESGVPGIHFYVLNRSKACEIAKHRFGSSQKAAHVANVPTVSRAAKGAVNDHNRRAKGRNRIAPPSSATFLPAT